MERENNLHTSILKKSAKQITLSKDARNRKRGAGKLEEDSSEIYSRLPTDLCNEDYFKPWFMSMDSLKRKHYPIASDDVEGDFFYFNLVPE